MQILVSQINDDIPDFFRDLIERCWAQDPENRPSFAQIVDELKNGNYFRDDDLIDELEFIDKCGSSFDPNNRLLHFDEFVKAYGNRKNVTKINLKEEEKISSDSFREEEQKNEANETQISFISNKKTENENENNLQNADNHLKMQEKENQLANIKIEDKNGQKVQEEEKYLISNMSNISPQKVQEDEGNCHLLYPAYEFINLNEKCKKHALEAEKDPQKQFEVARSLLEGINDFPLNIALGKEYLDKSFNNK